MHLWIGRGILVSKSMVGALRVDGANVVDVENFCHDRKRCCSGMAS